MAEIQGIKHGHRFKDITGSRFGRLVVQNYDRIEKRETLWVCLCDCGVVCTVGGRKLITGNTKSCGCLKREGGIKKAVAITHGCSRRMCGHSRTAAYQAWLNMKSRCGNPKRVNFSKYGGRGIVVCQRWLASFQNFLDDMGEPPKGMELDRINNDGNYEPGNCKWSTETMQARNRSTNLMVTFNGETLCLAAWSERLGIHRRTLQNRLARWTIEKSFSTPVRTA